MENPNNQIQYFGKKKEKSRSPMRSPLKDRSPNQMSPQKGAIADLRARMENLKLGFFMQVFITILKYTENPSGLRNAVNPQVGDNEDTEPDTDALRRFNQLHATPSLPVTPITQQPRPQPVQQIAYVPTPEYISSWVLMEKYGLGYKLSSGSVGAFFNDASLMCYCGLSKYAGFCKWISNSI